MRSLVGLRRYRDKNTVARDSDDIGGGLTNHDRAICDMSRQEIEGFLCRIQEIQECRRRITWAKEGPGRQKKFSYAIPKVEFNHYEAYY